jgi:hypothetical protein
MNKTLHFNNPNGIMLHLDTSYKMMKIGLNLGYQVCIVGVSDLNKWKVFSFGLYCACK